MPKEVKTGALVIGLKLVENISRFQAKGAVARLDNMMLSTHERGVIVNSPGVKNLGTPSVDIDEVEVKWRRAPGSGIQTYNGINFLGVTQRKGGREIDNIVAGARSNVSSPLSGDPWKQEFWWAKEQSDQQSLNVITDGLNEPYETIGGNDNPHWKVPVSSTVHGEFLPLFWKGRGWKNGTMESTDQSGHTFSVSTNPAAGTLSLIASTTEGSGGFTYESTGSTGNNTATIKLATEAHSETIDVTFEVVAAPSAGSPVATHRHYLQSYNSHRRSNGSSRVKIAASEVTIDQHVWKHANDGGISTVTASTGSTSYGTIAAAPSSHGTNIFYYFPRTDQAGQVDIFTVTYTLDNAVTTTASWYVWIAPDPGNSQWTKIHTINSPAHTNSKAGPVGIWSHATMGGDTYFFNGEGTFGTAGSEVYWSCESETPSTITTSIGGTGLDASGLTSATTTSAGEVRGTVRYKVSRVVDGVEQPLSKSFKEVELDGLTNTVTIGEIPTTNTGDDTTRIYRTYADQRQYYFLDYVTYVDGTDPYTDTKNDLELGDFPKLHGESPPENAMSPVVYYDRMYCLGGTNHNTLFWSDLESPHSWSTDTNYAEIYADDGDYGTGIFRDFNGLIVTKSNHIYRLAGRTPQDFVLSELVMSDQRDTSIGCPHIGAAVSTPIGLFFYWKRAVYLYRSGVVKKISTDIDPTLSRIKVYHEDQIHFGFWPDEYFVVMSFGRDNFDTGNEATWGVTYIYSLEEKGFIGRLLGFYGPYANLIVAPDDNRLAGSREWISTLCAGGHNNLETNTATNLRGRVFEDSLQVVYFDNEYPELGSAGWTSQSDDRAKSIGRAEARNESTTAGESHGVRALEFQPFYGESDERTLMKRFVYVDFIVSDVTSDFNIQIDVDDVTSVVDQKYEVTAGSAGYTVYRCYVGAIGWKLTARIDFRDNNDNQMAIFGGTVGYQNITDLQRAVPPRGRVA